MGWGVIKMFLKCFLWHHQILVTVPTSLGRDPCCTLWVLVWVWCFQDSCYSGAQAGSGWIGYLCILQSSVDSLGEESRPKLLNCLLLERSCRCQQMKLDIQQLRISKMTKTMFNHSSNTVHWLMVSSPPPQVTEQGKKSVSLHWYLIGW